VISSAASPLHRRTRWAPEKVAEQIGVDKCSIVNWEGNHSNPALQYMPAIIELGYNPLRPATNWAERLIRHRMTHGLTQKESARRIGVDPSTLARWERGASGNR
jgi:transcriptional regulator with XRE-family HTH domain